MLRRALLRIVVLVVLGGFLSLTLPPAHLAPPPVSAATASTSSTAASFAALPLSFVPNAGQTDPAVRFTTRSLGGNIFFTPSEIVLALPTPTQLPVDPTSPCNPSDQLCVDRHRNLTSLIPPIVARLRFAGANTTTSITATDRLPGIANYLIGNDPARWRTGLPTYAGITYQQLYPGIDLHYDGAGGLLKSTYVVAPGADPLRIRWRYEGATSVSLDNGGNLLIVLPSLNGVGSAITLTEHAPVAWQEIGSQRVAVAVSYTIAVDSTVGFVLGAYDPTQPLILDPALTYSTKLGGVGADAGYAIAVDRGGNAYVTGETASLNFPSAGFLQPLTSGGTDTFIAKLNATGSALVYSTYLGGSSNDIGYGIAVDGTGNAYVTGTTASNNFPMAAPLRPSFSGGVDGFIAKLNPAGSALNYSTYLGGSGRDLGYAITVDGTGNAYVTGSTDSLNFPTANPRQPVKGGSSDAFVTKVNGNGSAFVYSTYHGGSSVDEGYGIAMDTVGNAAITGITFSFNFPTASPRQGTKAGLEDAFVTKLNASGNGFLYSTYLGGTSTDWGYGIAIDADGSAYTTGYTVSTNFPTASAAQGGNGGMLDAFVTKLSNTGGLLYGTYLGGNDTEYGYGIAVDADGNALVTGLTFSTNFPRVRPLQNSFGGGDGDAFITTLKASGSELDSSTYLGGSGRDVGYGAAVDRTGNAYIVGETNSANFPLKGGLRQVAAGRDAFTVKLNAGIAPPPTTSYYMSTIDTGTAFQLGCAARRDGEQGIVVLDFGSPRNLGTDIAPIHGTRLLRGARDQVSLSQIAIAVEAFAFGYWNVAVCNDPPTNPVAADLVIAIGTTNSLICGNNEVCEVDDEGNITNYIDNPALTAAHGSAWATMVTDVNSYLQGAGYYPLVQAAGGYDAEFGVGWNSAGTIEWAEGYNQAATAFFYNFGSCEDCPRKQARATWTPLQLQALERVYQLSWGLVAAKPLPQIYFAPYADEWYNVRRYAREQYNRNMMIAGVLTGCGRAPNPPGCDFDDLRQWSDVPVGHPNYLSPRQGWLAMYDTLNASSAPDGSPNTVPQPELPWLTDIIDQ